MQANIILGLLVLLVGGYYYMKVNSLEAELALVASEASTYEESIVKLKEAIENQNISLEKNKVDKKLAESKLKEFLDTPVKERVIENTTIIYKDINTTREDRKCEDYKKLESNTYNLDWNN